MSGKISTTCWCCQATIEVDDNCYKPYTCLECDKGEHNATEFTSDEFECEVTCECKLKRIVYVKRKGALDLFKNRENIKCKGCKSKKVTLRISPLKGRTLDSVTVSEVMLAKEWKGKTPKELVEEA